MKKIYLSAAVLSLGTLGFAQLPTVNKAPAKKSIYVGGEQKTPQVNAQNSNRAVIWQDDMSNPANWTTNNNSSPSTDWMHTTDVNASPVAALSPIGTSTAANGYYIIDSDAQGQQATQDADLTTAAPIDLSLYPNVFLTFEEVTRHFAETYTVQVSGDNGGSWTDYQMNTDMAANTNSDNPDIESFDISAAAGGQSQVLIRFNYQGAWDWFWAVDDVKIEEAPNDEFGITKANFGSIGAYSFLPYYLIPTAQMTDIEFSTEIKNIGLNDQDLTLDVDVNSGAFTGSSAQSNVLSGANDSLFSTTTFLPTATGTYDITMTLNAERAGQVDGFDPTPVAAGSGYTDASDVPTTGGSGTGLTVDIVTAAGAVASVSVNATGGGYNVGDIVTITTGNADAEFEITAVKSDVTDANPADNTASYTIEGTDNVYARDMNMPEAGSFNQGNGYEMGNVFDVFADQTMYSIGFQPAGTSDASLGPILIYATLYEIDPNTGDFVYVAGSDELSLTQQMIDNGDYINLPFSGGVQVTAGGMYLAVVGTYGNGGQNDELVITTSGQSEAQTTFLLDQTDQTWYYMTSTPMVRMNFDQATTVNEAEKEPFAIGQNVPNPFNNSSYINYTIEEASDVNFTVVDMMGKTVMNINKGTQAAGQHRIDLDATNFAEGVYFYTFTIGNKQVTKKMVIASK